MSGPTVEFKVHFRTSSHGRQRMREGARPAPPEVKPGQVPQVTRLMALAIRYDRLIRERHVRDYAEIARLGGVTRARISQIMDLINLAPVIQEEILALPQTVRGRDPIRHRDLHPIVMEPDFEKQKRMWRTLAKRQRPLPTITSNPSEA